MVDIQTQLNFLKAKFEATAAVHAALITALMKASPFSEDLLEAVRQSVTANATGGDAVSVQNHQFAAEQFIQDELDRIRKIYRDLSR
ncbi:flagellar biosynthesis/type III secretory pathway M-ring protein FliF/YscJ [Bradyrhizobium sp. USDA 4448]